MHRTCVGAAPQDRPAPIARPTKDHNRASILPLNWPFALAVAGLLALLQSDLPAVSLVLAGWLIRWAA